MKKLFVLILSFITVIGGTFAFSACNGNENGTMIVKDLILVKEEYGIAGRKQDKAFVSEINNALIELCKNGTLKSVAEKYGLQSDVAVTESTVNPLADAEDESFEKIKQSGKVIIGYTVYAPIAYTDEKGEFVGFDIDLAKETIKYISEKCGTELKVEFQLIQWSAKEANLNEGTIDLIWNGLTIDDGRKENMCISVPYLYNNQVAVIRVADEAKYTKDTSTFASAIMGYEKGSAGEDVALNNNFGKEKLSFKSQLDAFNQLKAGTVDIVIIDSVMANYYISQN